MTKPIIFACLFVVSSVLATCPNGIANSGVNNNDKNFIVAKHNELRSKIMKGQLSGQPKGVNLKTIKWDDSLASEAQRIANTCEFKHQKANSNKWGWVGQNLYWTATSNGNDKGSDWNSACNGWFNEYKTYKFGNGFNHYTQAVWGNTEYIGCGFTAYDKNDGWKLDKLYVCNYGPGGNIGGQDPYQKA